MGLCSGVIPGKDGRDEHNANVEHRPPSCGARFPGAGVTRTVGRLVVFAAAMVGFGIGTAPAALAADDCGDGFHFDGGACVVNLTGPGGARFDPGHPNCRINDQGDQRCH